jgi:hypothetical protein
MLSQDILDFALNRLNKGARIVLCGEKQIVFEAPLMWMLMLSLSQVPFRNTVRRHVSLPVSCILIILVRFHST